MKHLAQWNYLEAEWRAHYALGNATDGGHKSTREEKKDMMEWNMITHIVDFMVETGTQETSSGNYNFYFDELAEEQVEHFGISKEYALEWLNEHYYSIADELDRREEVISETWYNYDHDGNVEGFDINFALDYCPNIEDEVWENV